jgi:multidrug efflux system membrane fusion protein
MNEEKSEKEHEPSVENQDQENHQETVPAIDRSRSKKRSRIAQVISVVFLVLLSILMWHFLGDKTDKAANKPRAEVVPVEIAPASQKDVPVEIRSIGNVEALSTIAVRSQIEGTLQKVYFTPGQEVKKGDILFTIDPRPLQAALGQAEANLLKATLAVRQGQDIVAKDQATARNLRIIAKRDATLVEEGVISREEYDNAASAADAADAAVRADQSAVGNLQAAVKAEEANVQNSKVQLSYTTIRAPLSGKTGNLAVTAGNLIRADDTTPMVTITQAAPIYATFAVPERDLFRIKQYSSSTEFKTQAIIPGDESQPAFGKLSLVDNTVDVTTGTIRLKATFENSDRRLYPGQFVNVVLTLGVQHDAIVVPSPAVQLGQDHSFVYVVKPDMTAEVRNIKTGAAIGDQTVIEEGLQAGEQVVTDGQLRLVPGAKVQAKSPQGVPGNKGNQERSAGYQGVASSGK